MVIREEDFKTEQAYHAALVKERKDFFSDLSVHSEETLLERFYVAVPDEIHGTPGAVPVYGNSHRPPDKGGLVWELKRRLALRKVPGAER